jgi:Transposase DDE domain
MLSKSVCEKGLLADGCCAAATRSKGGHDVHCVDWRRSCRANTVSSSAARGHEPLHGPPFSPRRGANARNWCARAVTFAAILLSWEPAGGLVERFAFVRDLLRSNLPRGRRPGGTYQGLAKALQRHGPILIGTVKAHLRTQIVALAGACMLRRGHLAFAADGSRYDAPRTIANERALGFCGRGNSHPQACVTTLWHMGTALPWDWRVGPAGEPERTHLRAMQSDLPAGALVVADAGFTGYELLKELHDAGRFFLIRVGRHTTLLENLGCAIEEKNTNVLWLWPEQKQGTPPLAVRRIKLGTGVKAVWLITNHLDPARLSDADAGVLYQMRWGVEVFHRHSKQTLERRTLASASPLRALLEMEWIMVGLLLLGLLAVRELIARGHDPLALSMAAALRAVRRVQHRPELRQTPGSLRRALGRCIKDRYTRSNPKASRPWPRKKKCKPPGRPAVRPATPNERRKARAFQTS